MNPEQNPPSLIKPQNPESAPSPIADQPSAPGTDAPKSKRFLILVITVIVLLATAGGGAWTLLGRHNQKNTGPSTTRVKVGVLMALSGPSSSMGYGSMKGIQLAKKQLGADNIEIIQADGKCDPKTAPEAMQYLIDQGVVAVVGENCSSASVAILPQANENKILLLSPSASSPKLSIKDDYFYRTVPSDVGQGSFLAESMYKQGIRKAGVFYTNEPYGTAINDVFKEKFEGLGGTVVVATTAESGVIDVATQVNVLRAAKPEGIAIVTNSTVSAIAVIKLARQAGMSVPMFSGDNLYDNTIITNGGAAADGLKVVSFPTGSRSFKQSLLNEYQVTEQLYAASEAYDAFKTIYLAVQKGATTREQIKQTVPTISFEGASAQIKFDEYGEIPYQGYKYELLEVKDGAFTSVTQ